MSNSLTFTTNFQGTGLSVYPQPASNVLYIDNLKLSDNWETLDLVTTEGKICLAGLNISNQIKITLDIAHLPAAMYVAVLRRKDKEPVQFKFLKL